MTTSRRGMTIVELLIAMVVASIVGAALISLMIGQGRMTERAEAQRAAIRVSRSALNALMADLRMVDPLWGVESADPASITARIPYALGITCSSTASLQIILLLPVDSIALELPGYSGYATRGGTGVYTPVAGGTLAEETVSGTCTGSPSNAFAIAAPSTAPNQKTRQIAITTVGAIPVAVGTPVMLYRRTRYYFEPSGQAGLSGRNALWRDWLDDDNDPVELAAPFHDSAAFRFFEFGVTDPVAIAPADLTAIVGLELFLPGESDLIPRTRTSPAQADLTSQVFFVNRSE